MQELLSSAYYPLSLAPIDLSSGSPGNQLAIDSQLWIVALHADLTARYEGFQAALRNRCLIAGEMKLCHTTSSDAFNCSVTTLIPFSRINASSTSSFSRRTWERMNSIRFSSRYSRTVKSC